MNRKRIRRPNDFHSHFRSPAQVGERCFEFVVRKNATHYRFVVAEPNTYLDDTNQGRHIETARDVVHYRRLVRKVLKNESQASTVLFLIKITPRTTPAIIREAKQEGCIGGKMYPEGVTTGSHVGGVDDFFAPSLLASLATLEEEGLICQIHPEKPHTFCLDREVLFHDVIRQYVQLFPKLRIFVEHITDRRTLELVKELNAAGHRVYGTITGHHLRLTLDDVLGRNENHCWPCAKYPEDRDALVAAALEAPPYLISITDSAPWKWNMKHPTRFVPPMNGCACAGVFNPAEVAIPWLVQRFEGAPTESLERFWSTNGLAAYGLTQLDDDLITLVEHPWHVSHRYQSGGGGITPFLTSSALNWQLEA